MLEQTQKRSKSKKTKIIDSGHLEFIWYAAFKPHGNSFLQIVHKTLGHLGTIKRYLLVLLYE